MWPSCGLKLASPALRYSWWWWWRRRWWPSFHKHQSNTCNHSFHVPCRPIQLISLPVRLTSGRFFATSCRVCLIWNTGTVRKVPFQFRACPKSVDRLCVPNTCRWARRHVPRTALRHSNDRNTSRTNLDNYDFVINFWHIFNRRPSLCPSFFQTSSALL